MGRPWRASELAQRLTGAKIARGLWDVRFALLTFIVTVSWLPLVRSYSLPDNQNNTHFAFEKIPGRFDSPILPATLVLFLILGAAYVAGYVLLARQDILTAEVKLSVGLLVIVPIVANLFLYPVGALDVFNYMVELKLAYWYDRNPYITTFVPYRHDPFALPAFMTNVPLFYGPFWLLSAALPVAVAGFGSIIGLLVSLKVFNVVLLAATGYLIYRACEDNRAGLLGAYLFLANPLVIFEAVANAHNDVLMTALLVAALVALTRRSPAAPGFLALSALVKLFTLVLAPLFLTVALRERWGRRRLLLGGAVAIAVTVVAFAPYWADGAMIGGFRRGIAKSQQMDHVSILSLAQQTVTTQPMATWASPLFPGERWRKARYRAKDPGVFTFNVTSWVPGKVAAARQTRVAQVCALVLGALTLAVARSVYRGRSWESGAVITLMLFALLMTKLYPWYLIPIFAVIAMWQDRRSLVYTFVATTLGLAYYPAYVYARFEAGLSDIGRHLVLAFFLTVPLLVYLGVEFASARDGRRSLLRLFQSRLPALPTSSRWSASGPIWPAGQPADHK